MLHGIKLKANPTKKQKLTLSQWMGCSRHVWNAKCDEEKYYSTFARKYYPIGTYAPIDQTTAQFKDKELTPWLYDCPSQIIRNSAVNWYQTYQKFMKGKCGKPKRKIKSDKGSIHLTRELFTFDFGNDGVRRLFIGTKTNNIGYLSYKSHHSFNVPNSIYIRKERGQYYISFCYDDGETDSSQSIDDIFKQLKNATKEYLNDHVIGLDRGIAIPLQAGDQSYDFTRGQKNNKSKAERHIKRLQRKLAKQKKVSKRRQKTKNRIAKYHAKCRNIHNDFCHKISRELVNSSSTVFILEDLKTQNMTKKAKPKKDINGKFVSNKAAQKSALNKAILDKGWYQLEVYLKYKSKRTNKVIFKINAAFTSQECANCDHIHPDNRVSQKEFHCESCGHIDNADRNASLVIKKRAIKLLLNTGTVLSARGVIISPDIGRGAESKPSDGTLSLASGDEPSKKKRLIATKVAA